MRMARARGVREVRRSGNMRARLTVLSRMYPDAVDAAITAWPQVQPPAFSDLP